MDRYRQGDVAAFEELLVRHERSVYSFAYRFNGERSQADDILQEVFLRVIRGAESFRSDAKFSTWLYRITRNVCIDMLRRRKSSGRAYSIDAAEAGEAENPAAGIRDTLGDGRESVERQAIRHEVRTVLDRAIAELPEAQRDVFLLRERAGLPFEEIAEVVGAPKNTVKSRMRYALDNLRKTLLKEQAGREVLYHGM